jgi:hypothetical protein
MLPDLHMKKCGALPVVKGLIKTYWFLRTQIDVKMLWPSASYEINSPGCTSPLM